MCYGMSECCTHALHLFIVVIFIIISTCKCNSVQCIKLMFCFVLHSRGIVVEKIIITILLPMLLNIMA